MSGICSRCRCNGVQFWKCAKYGTNPKDCRHFMPLKEGGE